MLPLHGTGVLVTRPPHQATRLCRLLEARGAVAHRFAALDIRPHEDRRACAARLGRIEDFELVIFSSANAVRFGAELLDEKRELTIAAIGPATARALTIAAIGPATARALNQAGFRVAVLPTGGFDSHQLLRHPKLTAVAGTRILLIKGTGGRDLLREELTRRGALVSAVEVYRREPIRPSAVELGELTALFEARSIQVVTATSAEIAGSLLALATPALRRWFDQVHWLVPGARVAQSLREQGLAGPVLHADSADDQDLVSALVRWRAGESGA